VRFRLALSHRARLFQVDRPRRFLPGRILDDELKDAVVLSYHMGRGDASHHVSRTAFRTKGDTVAPHLL
jgi:hypothetical protein